MTHDMTKTFVRKIAEHPEWDVPLFLLTILLPVVGFGLDYLVPAWDVGRSLANTGKPGYGFIPPIISVVFSIAIGLQLREARSVRYWQEAAEKINRGHDIAKMQSSDKKNEIVLRSWKNITMPIFSIAMGAFPFFHPSVRQPWLPWFSWLFVLGGIWFLLVRTRWSPLGIPEIEITSTQLRIPNPTGLWIDGKKEKRRSYLTGVLSIPVDRVKDISWGMYGYNTPTLRVHCTRLTVEHPFLKRPPETVTDQDCVVLSSLAAGSVAADAIVAFVEKLIAQEGSDCSVLPD